MSKTRLTKTIIDTAKYEGKGRSQYVIWDAKVPGFGLRIQPSGQKSFIIYYRNKLGQQRSMALGKYGVLTLDQARSIAKIELGNVEKGEDPALKKKQNTMGETFGEFGRSYIENHSKPNKKTWEEDQRYLEQYIYQRFGRIKLKHIDKKAVYDFHQELRKSHSLYVANRALSLISSLFNKALEWGALEAGFPNPTKGIKKFKEIKRDRWLTEQELVQLNAALLNEENIYARYAIVFFLFTGVRKSELLKARWEDVIYNGANSELLLPKTKSGEQQYIHLSQAALQLLKVIPRVKDNPYIFVGGKPGKHLVNINKAWKRIREDAGIQNARIHDLRRTLGSRMVQEGHSLKLIKETLRHKDIKTTEIYARIADSQKQQAIETQGESLGKTFLQLIEG